MTLCDRCGRGSQQATSICPSNVPSHYTRFSMKIEETNIPESSFGSSIPQPRSFQEQILFSFLQKYGEIPRIAQWGPVDRTINHLLEFHSKWRIGESATWEDSFYNPWDKSSAQIIEIITRDLERNSGICKVPLDEICTL